jgi:hypothetical protein
MISAKTAMDDQRKDGDDGPQEEEDNEQEEGPYPVIHQAGRYVADGAAVVTERDHQGPEVMDRAKEDGAEEDPHHRRDPAPKEDALVGRHEVDIIPQFMRWADIVGCEFEDLAAQEFAVGMVSHKVPSEHDNREP